jgi:hypothetical protein
MARPASSTGTPTTMRSDAYEEMKPDADDLLVFVDDAGHETFAAIKDSMGSAAVSLWLWHMPPPPPTPQALVTPAVLSQ